MKKLITAGMLAFIYCVPAYSKCTITIQPMSTTDARYRDGTYGCAHKENLYLATLASYEIVLCVNIGSSMFSIPDCTAGNVWYSINLSDGFVNKLLKYVAQQNAGTCGCSGSNWTDCFDRKYLYEPNVVVSDFTAENDFNRLGNCQYRSADCDAANNNALSDAVAGYISQGQPPTPAANGCVQVNGYEKASLTGFGYGNMSGIELCSSAIQNIAPTGWYKNTSTSCQQCPAAPDKNPVGATVYGTTSGGIYMGYGYNDITDCYISRNTILKDETGSYQFDDTVNNIGCKYSR